MFGEEQPCVGVLVRVYDRDARSRDSPDYDVVLIYTGKTHAIHCPPFLCHDKPFCLQTYVYVPSFSFTHKYSVKSVTSGFNVGFREEASFHMWYKRISFSSTRTHTPPLEMQRAYQLYPRVMTHIRVHSSLTQLSVYSWWIPCFI